MKEQFTALLPTLHDAYEKSDIKRYCTAQGHEWGYALITTACVPQAPLIIGFNWGAGAGEKYTSQDVIEEESWRSQSLGSMSRIIPFYEQHMPDVSLDHASQTNYCFFRSKTEKQISARDMELCKPIFNLVLDILQPSIVLCFSSKLRDYMVSAGHITDLETKSLTSKRGESHITYHAKRGKLASGVTIACLPHPNYPLQTSVREAAWSFCARGE